MKSFLKQICATIVGIVLACIILAVFGIVSMVGMMATEGVSKSIEKNSVLRIRLQGSLDERAQEDNPFYMISGDEIESIGLDEALDGLEKAAKDDNIAGIYLEAGALGTTPAMAEELRHALIEFKKSGKWIIAYGDTYSKSAYYLCSAADKVYLNPIGMLDWSGLASEPMFYKETLEKIGVKMQVFKVGTFKSAVEPFTCTEMSEPNRLQVTSFLGSIWGNWLKDVAASRKLKVDALNAAADSMILLSEAEATVKSGLVDKLCYIDEVRTALRSKLGLEEDDDIKFVSLKDVVDSETLKEKIDEEVAVYYAYGNIVEETVSGFYQEHQIVGKDVVKDLKELREDDDVKAVVIRVNSGGGSAYASEQIWREVQLLKAKKPVVISMGGMAASGGYYISCGANKIFAEKTTLTGSIGIFGMIPDASELLTDKLGLHFDVVKTNAMSDFGAMGRPFNAHESALMQAYVNKGYELFTERVASGRKMKQDSVKAIAEGRVWTGEQAVKIGLVDKIGDLKDAVREAAKLAKIEDYAIGTYPAEKPWYVTMFDEKKSSYLEDNLKAVLGDNYQAICALRVIQTGSPLQARIPFDPNIH